MKIKKPPIVSIQKLIQDFFEKRVQMPAGGSRPGRGGTGFEVTGDVLLHHAALGDAGTDDGAGGGEVLEGVGPELAQQGAHGRRLDVEAPHGPSFPARATSETP